jgi:hypothetical protein
METRLRMRIVLGGLSEPQVNLKLRNEYAEQHDDDIHRREYLDRHGWRIIVVNSRGIYRHPENTLMWVRNALLDRGFPACLVDSARTGWRTSLVGTAKRVHRTWTISALE